MWPDFWDRVRYPDFSWFGWSFSYSSERYDDDPRTKVVQLIETEKMMYNKSYFGQLFGVFPFFGPLFSLWTVNLPPFKFHFYECFLCIFEFFIDWKRWNFVTYREILQDDLKTERKWHFSRFLDSFRTYFWVSTIILVCILFSSSRRIEWVRFWCSNTKFEKSLKNRWFAVTREIQNFLRSHAHQLLQRLRLPYYRRFHSTPFLKCQG